MMTRGNTEANVKSTASVAQGDEFTFAPLGGVGEIGMNLSIYGFGGRRQRAWLAVDLGVSFGDEEHLPGIDTIMPDISFLVKERKNLVGLVLTHAHEDHFGAIIDLWPQLKCPIYATKFSAALFEAKCAAERNPPKIPITVVPSGGRIELGPFGVEFIPVAHSIPESHALAIHTAVGTALHTGDWKLDPTPVVGSPTDERRLRELGDAGVMALIGDSTNAVREGRSPSETEVAKTIAELVKAARGRVAVTTFASNVARLRAVADAARLSGREVVVVGRAMERVVQVARETGYLDGVQNFRSAELYGHFPPDKVLALCTGSQGEPRAALARIANDDHPQVTLNKGDCVIFSSRTIPGNEKAVGSIINGLIGQGIEVITDRTHLVHVSGHPRRDELRDMIGWVRPQLLIPVHGEALHLFEHAKLARAVGVPKVLICRNGDLVKLGPGEAGIIEELPSGRLYKDGNILEDSKSRAVVERRRLGFAGCAFVALAMDEKGELADDPEIELIGIPEKNVAGEPIDDIVFDIVVSTVEGLPRARRRDPDALAESVRRAVRATVNEHWGKKPLCFVHVLTV
jgi:ribonuclease J